MGNNIREIAGISISFERHGDPAQDPVILVHCGGGQSGWWSQVTPALTQSHHVITLDLSGHGDSGRRPEYDPALWAREVGTLAQELVPSRQVALVGHSLGGLVSIYCAAAFPDLVKQLVLIDPPVLDVQLRAAPPPSRIYEEQEEALSRFRLRPPETFASAARLREIAAQGLQEVPGGWTWKYDPLASQRFTVDGVAAQLANVQCPTACIYGDLSPYASAETAEYIGSTMGQTVHAVVIPRAYHHVPLDAPDSLAAAIDAALLSQA